MSTRAALLVTDEERAELRRLVRQPGTRQAMATRCKVILLDEQGWTYAAIGAKLDLREQTVLKWRKRFLTHRLAGLKDKPRPGAKRTITDAQTAESCAGRWKRSPRTPRTGVCDRWRRLPGSRVRA